MTQALEIKQLSLGITGEPIATDIEVSFCTAGAIPTVPVNGISGSVLPVNIFPAKAGGGSLPSPAPANRLPEGWVNTSQGDVYISPGGAAWVVERRGDALVSVPVKLSKTDIIGQNAVEKRKEAVRKAARRQSTHGQRTTSPILTAQAAAIAHGEGLEVR